LVVAGETYGGKSNFLHQAIACLVQQENVELYVIDLKKVEFGYLKDHAEIALALPDAVRALETLSMEMIRRMDLLLNKRIPKIQEYKHDGSLPYIVLVIDELSQLSPALAKDAGVKALRTIALQCLTDILCLARALGIHVIVSTQRPDKDILPGQLKANIPAALCFKVKNETNSRIVLDNSKADQLPRIKGRAVWQFDVEREVQVQYLPVSIARRLLPEKPLTKPVRLEPSYDGRV
jgi:S-DNA-T family DNA segregation ATPase FtsK/SpoIIIE